MVADTQGRIKDPITEGPEAPSCLLEAGVFGHPKLVWIYLCCRQHKSFRAFQIAETDGLQYFMSLFLFIYVWPSLMDLNVNSVQTFFIYVWTELNNSKFILFFYLMGRVFVLCLHMAYVYIVLSHKFKKIDHACISYWYENNDGFHVRSPSAYKVGVVKWCFKR